MTWVHFGGLGASNVWKYKSPTSPKDVHWYFEWQGGGYNDVWAPTRAVALSRAKAMGAATASKLAVNEKSLRADPKFHATRTASRAYGYDGVGGLGSGGSVETSHGGGYIVRGKLYQSDWKWPRLAESLGWSLRRVQKRQGKARHLARIPKGNFCRHSGTDGTVTCPDCGVTATAFINAAAEFLDRKAG